MKRIKEFHLLILALVGILVFSVLKSSSGESGSSQRPYGVNRSEPDGALALRLWLQKSGYKVQTLMTNPLQPKDVDVLFVLEPSTNYTPAEAETVRRWVTQGHTLIVAGTWSSANSMLAAFDVKLGQLVFSEGKVSSAAPTLVRPPFNGLYLGGAVAQIEGSRQDIAVHWLIKNRPVLASFSEGKGMVWVVGSAYPFSNQGLRDEASARFIMNLLADVPPKSTIGFDESLHETSELTLNDWVFTTPAGQSIILLIVLVMGYLVLRGRRFGRPQPILIEQLRREPTEYIQALATLFRRSGQRSEVLRHYKSELIRHLARRYALDPRLSDADLIRSLEARDSELDVQELAKLLHDLSARQVSEQRLVEIAMKVNGWIGEKR